MDYTFLEKKIEEQYLSRLSRHRADHSRRTALFAREMAVQYGQSPEKAFLAGLSHDLAKERPDGELISLAKLYRPEDIREDEIGMPLLLHGRAAAALLAEELGVRDGEILESVTWHITGRAGMEPLSRIIYCADFLEPGRTFLTEEFRRKALSGDLDSAVRTVLTSLLYHRKIKKHTPCERERDLMESLGLGEFL